MNNPCVGRGRAMSRLASMACAGLLLLTGGLKVIMPSPHSFLGHDFSIVLGVIEIGVCGLVLFVDRLWPVLLCELMAILGVLIHFVFRPRDCGCLGRAIVLDDRWGLIAAGVLGLFACLASAGRSRTCRVERRSLRVFS